MDRAGPPPRIALWGAFDVEDAGHVATRRVVERGLRRRLPDAEVTALAPLGALRPLAVDGGRPAEPLGPWSAQRRAELAARFDTVLVIGEDTAAGSARGAELWGDAAASARWLVDGFGPGPAPSPPIEWAVSGSGSRQRLEAAGVTGEIFVLPPFALLVAELVGEDLLAARLELQRLMEWSWPPGPVLTVHGDRSLLAGAGAIAAALLPAVAEGTLRVQLAAPGRHSGEDDFADALEAALGGRCRRFPGVAGVEDLVAAVAGSAAFLGPPGLGLWTAAALGIPAAAPGSEAPADGQDPLAELGIPGLPLASLEAGVRRLLTPGAPRPAAAAAVARLEAHLDAVAGRAAAAAAGRVAGEGRGAGTSAAVSAEERLAALGCALEARGRQIFEERAAFEVEAAGLRAELERMGAELAAARRDNDLIVGSRTWRYSQGVRDALARMRERHR